MVTSAKQPGQLLAWLVVAFCCSAATAAAAEIPSGKEPAALGQLALPLFQKYCITCHGPGKQEADLRLDRLQGDLLANNGELEIWSAILSQLETAQMPPPDAKQPAAEQRKRLIQEVRAELSSAGAQADRFSEAAYPNRGNLVDHDQLFNQPSTSAPATPARIWRLSPYAYLPFLDSLTGGPLMVEIGPGVGMSAVRTVVVPFGLSTDPGFRDYAFRYKVSGSETQQLAINAKVVLASLLNRGPEGEPPQEFTVIANVDSTPSSGQIRAAIVYFFRQVLYRDPTREELSRFSGFVSKGIERFGNRDGLVNGLVPVLLHPEAIFRSELGQGKPDEHGRRFLAPMELAVAIAYALTDQRPDETLLAAAREGRLSTPDDVRREVTRLLDDPKIAKPRILRFFQEYFDYTKAPDVFKDAKLILEAGIAKDPATFEAGALVRDTDRLVAYVLAKDRQVLRELLTTNKTYIGSKGAAISKNQALKYLIHKHYKGDLTKATGDVLQSLPADQRAGILTQPSWLIAHSANTENHAIHRGKWIRERLLGGNIPDTPITVEAKLPDDPQQTLRERMHVTREAFCFKCHVMMDPLGLPFEIYNHFGQFRTTELGMPVDASGEIIGSGEAGLDGPVDNALEMIRKLADSERVQQVFTRHAFRYWLGRNELLTDAPTLQVAYRAYRDNDGSMKALLVSLLTSDSFLYRIPEKTASGN